MAQYDENLLKNFADKLYKQADHAVFMTALLYGIAALLAGFVGSFILVAISHPQAFPVGSVSISLAVVGACLGAREGYEKSFQLRLDAQKILVQVQIEQNSRKS
jgi:hypothetical protein